MAKQKEQPGGFGSQTRQLSVEEDALRKRAKAERITLAAAKQKVADEARIAKEAEAAKAKKEPSA